MSGGRGTLAASAALALACAGAAPRPGERTYRFPEAFEATQVVTVALDSGPQEALASVRRRGADYEVTLFEPTFAAPLLTAAARGGAVSEELLVAGPRRGDGLRLVKLLADVFGRAYRAGADGRGEARGSLGAYALDGLPGPGPCAFPAAVDVSPTLGLGPHVHARTVDVSCGAPPAAP